MRWSLPVTMTARVRRPFVASTSFVLPLALSMSRFPGSESSATIATICSATTTLPCPTFTRCVTSRLPPFVRLFKILRLLAHLLDDPLGGERRLAELEVVRLRRDRVDLAIQLLDQEVQRRVPPPPLRDTPRARRVRGRALRRGPATRSRPRASLCPACARRPGAREPTRASRHRRAPRCGPVPAPPRRIARRARRRHGPAA